MLDFNLVTKIFQYKLKNLYKKTNKSGHGRNMGSGAAKKIPRGEPEGISLTLKTTNMVIMLIPIQPQIRSIAAKGLLEAKKFKPT